jgi:hypothetical protein
MGRSHSGCRGRASDKSGQDHEQIKDNLTKCTPPRWTHLSAMWSAEQAEHARVPGYELTAFVLAADRAKGWDRVIGWEVHGGAQLLDLIAKGNAGSFEDAKTQAEAAWHRVTHALSDSTASRPVPKGSRRLSPKCVLRRDPE